MASDMIMGQKFSIISTVLILIFMLANSAIAEEMLFSDEVLNGGEFIENGPYKFIMQTDCNLVLYMNGNRVPWSSATNGRGTSCRATLQNNGNLVILSGSDVLWNSDTALGPNTYRLIVQSDGNVVIYGTALWATNTGQGTRTMSRMG